MNTSSNRKKTNLKKKTGENNFIHLWNTAKMQRKTFQKKSKKPRKKNNMNFHVFLLINDVIVRQNQRLIIKNLWQPNHLIHICAICAWIASMFWMKTQWHIHSEW